MEDEVEIRVSEVQPQPESRGRPLGTLVRRMMLAAVGAIAISREEIEQVVSRLVERGELAEREGRQLVREVLERRKQHSEKLEQKSESDADSRLEQLLGRLNIPTKRDIDELSEKIAELSTRIEELKRSRES